MNEGRTFTPSKLETLTPVSKTVSKASRTCSACGAIINLRWAKCLACGSGLDEAPELTAAPAIQQRQTQSICSANAIDSGTWDAEDWHAFFEERAGITQFDAGEPDKAEARAYECCIVEWLHRNPPPVTGPETCASCRQPLGRVGDDGVPVLTGDGGHLWLHHRCHAGWMARRRAEAATALAEFGLTRPE